MLIGLLAVCGLLSAPTAALAVTDHQAREKVSAQYAVVGHAVSARGSVRLNGPPQASGRLRAVLQIDLGRVPTEAPWRTRASDLLPARHETAHFFLSARHIAAARTWVRVEVLDGIRLIARSSPHRLILRGSGAGQAPRIHARARLTPGTINLAPRSIVAVSSTAAGQKVIVARAAAPRAGTIIISAASLHAPQGLLGQVRAVSAHGHDARLTLQPATLSQAYSDLSVSAAGSLGAISAASATGSPFADVRSHAALGGLDPSFRCVGASGSAVTHHVDISDLQVVVHAWLGKAVANPGVSFSISGQPTLDLNADLTGTVTCTAEASRSFPIVLPDGLPPLTLSIGPKFTITADGRVDADLKWAPSIDYAFTRREFGGDSSPAPTLTNGGSGLTVTGSAGFKLGLDLQATLSAPDGVVGLTGTVGPEIVGTLSATTTGGPCFTSTGMATADLGLFANFFGHWSYDLPTLTFGDVPLLTRPAGCMPANTPPGAVTITNPGTQAATVGVPIAVAVPASDSDQRAITLSVTGMPPGLSLDSVNDTIGGVPTQAGTYTTTVTARDNSGESATMTFMWVVASSRSTPTVIVTAPGDQTTRVNSSVALQILASDSSGYTPTFTASGLPPGLSITSGGLITGVPNTPGAYTATVTASALGVTGSTQFLWTVTPATSASSGDVWAWGSVATFQNSLQPAIRSESCPSASDCVNVGFSGADAREPWVSNPNEIIPLSGSGEEGELHGVSCASDSSCVAVGMTYYPVIDSGPDDGAPLIIDRVNGVWDAPQTVSLPANAASGRLSELDSISCSSPGDCTAVGVYDTDSNTQAPMIATETGGSWSAATEPPWASSVPDAQQPTIACTGPSDCTVAFGGASFLSPTYGTSYAAGVFAETAGQWAAPVGITLPADAQSNSAGFSPAIACPAAGACELSGLFSDSSGSNQTFLASQMEGTWQQAVDTPHPPDEASSPALANDSAEARPAGISCVSAENCAIAGTYSTATDLAPFFVDDSSGSLSVSEIPPPADETTFYPGVEAFACSPSGDCQAVGSYEPTNANNTSEFSIAGGVNGG